MSNSGQCQYEESVVKALVSQLPMPMALADHIRGCAQCSGAGETVFHLNKLAALSIDDPLPTAGLMMWKAALAERRSAAQQSRVILGWGEGLGLAGPLITALALLGVSIANGGVSRVALIAGAGLTFTLAAGIMGLIVWQRADRI
ncbi:MAG: hypothetical protein EXQ52_12235 [Bryobacterales bacterium]|nr:hypothetical protein [Bryobacterales bacterium]